VNFPWIIPFVTRTDDEPLRAYRTDVAGVVAVVVTHEREELLRDCLTALQEQTTAPRRILVVDNASSNPTRRLVAEEFPDVEFVRLARNMGGAGGFAVGIRHAVDVLDAECVWIMDDDTVPSPTALEQLLGSRESAPSGTEVLASRVLWTDGREHPMNTPRVRPFSRSRDVSTAAAAGLVPIRSASFVSVLIESEAVRRVGLPIADYFLWNDDFEYTARILRAAKGFQVPGSVVEHRTRRFGGADVDPGSRFRFEVRNKVWLFRRSDALGPLEKAMYGGASIRRWIAMYRGAGDRRALRADFRRGLAEGVAGGPRPNSEVFRGTGVGWADHTTGDVNGRTVVESRHAT
jgi:rhamnopyranosyl-N-acetylglucosaminyl-diphospho-decaprenol beta-1,3/1,4-galactofuranosyltransferase